MAEITYICKRTVVSTKPVEPEKYYQLSPLDRLMDQNHLRIVYYYDHVAATKTEEVGQMTKRLRESLAEVLTWFPKVTGRLQKNEKGQWMIKCNDAGVRMVEARAKGGIKQWLENVTKEKELRLIHWEDVYHKPYFWSTFYVQVTEFEEGGFAIGLSCTHLLADPTCVTMLINAWADTTLNGKMLSPPFFYPLPPRKPINQNPAHQPYAKLINHYKSTMEKSTPVADKKYSTIALLFTDPMVQACMDMGRAQSTSPSPFQALAGLFWVILSKINGLEESLVDMSICLDMRKVLGLDKGFFGNCTVYNKVEVDAETMKDNNKLPSATKAIGEVIDRMNNEGIMDLIEWLEERNDGEHAIVLNNGSHLVCSSLEDVDPYSACFEEGFQPVRVSQYIEPTFGLGHVLILRSPLGGQEGRVAMVTLSDDDLIRLREDENIRQVSPIILMGVTYLNMTVRT